jgi:hypothetical protein
MSSILIESTDTKEEVEATLKHYGLEAEEPEPEEDAEAASKVTVEDDAIKEEVPEPVSEETKSKTAAESGTAVKQEPVVPEEPHREDFDSEEKFETALEDFKDKQKPKGDGGFQRRIDKLTKKLRSAEAKLEHSKQQPEAKSTPVEAEMPAAEPAKPADTPLPKVEDFGTYEEYDLAAAKWTYDQLMAGKMGGKSIGELIKEQVEARVAAEVEAKVKRIQEEQAAAAALEEYTGRLDEARKVHDDFDEVVGNEEIKISPAMQHVMLRSEMGAEMAYYFGQNQTEADRIARLEPFETALELGKIEATLVHEQKAAKNAAEKPAKSDTPAPVVQKPRASAAPEPIKPVSTRTAAAGKDPSDMTPAEYNIWRDSGGGK